MSLVAYGYALRERIAPPREAWPKFRYNTTNTGSKENYAIQKGKWGERMSDHVYSSPAVAGNRIFVGTRDGFVVALDRKSGKVRWKSRIGGEVTSSIVVADGMVFAGCADGRLYVLDQNKGKGVIDFPVASTGKRIVSTPLVYMKRIYIGTDEGHLYCIDLLGRRPLWRIHTGGEIWSSPAIAYGRLFFGSNDSVLYCVDALTGDPLWGKETKDAVVSSPAVVNGRVFFGGFDGYMYCLTAGRGEEVWYRDLGAAIYSSPAVVGGRVYICCNDGSVYCLNASTGDIVWKQNLKAEIWASPAVCGGYVVVGGLNGYLHILSADNGEVLWSTQLGARIYGSAAIADGRIYIGVLGVQSFTIATPPIPHLLKIPEEAFLARVADEELYCGNYSSAVAAYASGAYLASRTKRDPKPYLDKLWKTLSTLLSLMALIGGTQEAAARANDVLRDLRRAYKLKVKPPDHFVNLTTMLQRGDNAAVSLALEQDEYLQHLLQDIANMFADPRYGIKELNLTRVAGDLGVNEQALTWIFIKLRAEGKLPGEFQKRADGLYFVYQEG
ncbi:PQQ-binding-like beta-propeller repeat protein [archaeon]|nr:PQQ-binding-like beta-propeller repeat protein [archaeon]